MRHRSAAHARASSRRVSKPWHRLLPCVSLRWENLVANWANRKATIGHQEPNLGNIDDWESVDFMP